MLKNTKNTLAAYVAGTAALAGSAAHGAVVYQAIGLTFADISTTDINSAQTLAAIRFDGTSITITNSTSGGAVGLSADDNYLFGTSAKVSEGGRSVVAGYSMSSAILTAGQDISPGFATVTTTQNFTGAASDQYIAVSTTVGQLGWIHFSYTNNGASVTVHDAAFQSAAGESIAAGTTVPETASASLIALAGGLAVLRRRRSAAV